MNTVEKDRRELENLKEISPFSKEDEKKLKEKTIKGLKNILESLDLWRRNSLSSSIRF